MNISKFVITVLMLLFFVMNSFGVEHHYLSKWKLTPDVVDSNWSSSYSTVTAKIVNDPTEGDVLSLDHTNPNGGAKYTYNNAPGAGTGEDIVIIDFRFKLIDTTQSATYPQFCINVNRPSSTGQYSYTIRIAMEGIWYKNNNWDYSLKTISLGTDWHNAHYIIDVPNNEAKLYIDDKPIPIITHAAYSTVTSSPANNVTFGDGSSTIQGKVLLSKFSIESHSALIQTIYKSKWKLTPDVVDSNWSSSYSTVTAKIVNDPTEGDVLSLDHTNPNGGAKYTYNNAPGAGTGEDIVIIDFRFKLIDTTQSATYPQFCINVNRPSSTGQYSYTIRIAMEGIWYKNNNWDYSLKTISLGTDWHNAHYIIDVANNEAKLYIDDKPIPIITHTAYSIVTSSPANNVTFGDGSSTIQGKVLLSKFSIESYHSYSNAIEELKLKRRQLARKPRRVIFNNDGGDALKYMGDINSSTLVDDFLAVRTQPLSDSHVDTISYCTLSGSFCSFTYPTKVEIVDNGNIYKGNFITVNPAIGNNIAPILADTDANGYVLGSGPLKVVGDWCKHNDKEFFWSMRMNDTHDYAEGSAYFLWSDLKEYYPELLFAQNSTYFPYGKWSAVNYSKPIIRKLVTAFIREICENYNINGIELDFFRHPVFFPSVASGNNATQSECDIMSNMMAQIRAVTEEVGLMRGKPILVAIRVPDSIGYCKAIGIDLEKWLADGLVDIMIGSGYFRLNNWSYLSTIKSNYDIMVYAGLSEPRVYLEGLYKRREDIVYRARAAEAWSCGVDGIYIFNQYNPNAGYLTEIGNKSTLTNLAQRYFLTYRDESPEAYLHNGNSYTNIPILTPENIGFLSPGNNKTFNITLGNINDTWSNIEGILWVPNYQANYNAIIKVNDKQVSFSNDNKYLKFNLSASDIHPGVNTINFSIPSRPHITPIGDGWIYDKQFVDSDSITWPNAIPLAIVNKDKMVVESEGLRINDNGSAAGDYNLLLLPLEVNDTDRTIIEVRAQVLNSNTPEAITVRVANNQHCEYLTLEANRISLKFAGVSYEMNTTSAFHTYKILFYDNSIGVYVDGVFRLNGINKFTTNITNDNVWPMSNYWSKYKATSAGVGSFSVTGIGHSRWKYLRYDTEQLAIKDVLIDIH